MGIQGGPGPLGRGLGTASPRSCPTTHAENPEQALREKQKAGAHCSCFLLFSFVMYQWARVLGICLHLYRIQKTQKPSPFFVSAKQGNENLHISAFSPIMGVQGELSGGGDDQVFVLPQEQMLSAAPGLQIMRRPEPAGPEGADRRAPGWGSSAAERGTAE